MSEFETLYHKNFRRVLRTLDVFLLEINNNTSTGICKKASKGLICSVRVRFRKGDELIRGSMFVRSKPKIGCSSLNTNR